MNLAYHKQKNGDAKYPRDEKTKILKYYYKSQSLVEFETTEVPFYEYRAPPNSCTFAHAAVTQQCLAMNAL